eukprot:TRINITY_DN16602_c1_g1_i1.p1 TRINITY_DN16602_c1_g1~~TRINITY_DN16602_c1_g1_i1.p1  ORF type:complete len:757 (+),score=76.49 TRINITY_DN16602_c1_g1_i1:144-2414(+)
MRAGAGGGAGDGLENGAPGRPGGKRTPSVSPAGFRSSRRSSQTDAGDVRASCPGRLGSGAGSAASGTAAVSGCRRPPWNYGGACARGTAAAALDGPVLSASPPSGGEANDLGRGRSSTAGATSTSERARSCTPPARPQGPRAAVSEASVRRIWQRLDRFNSGTVQVKDIVANATFVRQECPRLLTDYERIARGGCVKYQDVRRLLLGLMDKQGRNTATPTLRITEEDARALFSSLRDEEGVITAKTLADHKELVMQSLPALIQEFEQIDLDGDSKISWEELKVYVGGTAEWLEHELSAVVGLEDLKAQVRSFYRSMMLDSTRRLQGHDVRGPAKAPHMIFQGNPGTGKTSLGRIMAKLLHRIGIISTPELREVQRPDLVAEHVGQTGPKTQAVLNEAQKGVLFIDEAYRLTSVESKNDFGREAVETLMAAMNEPPGKAPVMIFAGYVKDMASFMRVNEGLYRRIGYTFEFGDYSPGDLAKILDLFTAAQGFEIEPTLLANDRVSLAQLIGDNTTCRARALMNGGLCERIFDGAKQSLDARDDPESPTVVISFDDVRIACQAIPPPPEPAVSGQVGVPSGPVPASAAHQDATVSGAAAAPEQHAMVLHQAQSHRLSSNFVDGERNVWFHVDAGDGLKRGWRTPCCGSRRAFVSVRLDRKEVHRTASRSTSNPIWGETRIVPYNGESLIEFALFCGATFAGSAMLALKDVDFFDGCLELRLGDKHAGKLQVKMGWQILAGASGADQLRSCFQMETIKI